MVWNSARVWPSNGDNSENSRVPLAQALLKRDEITPPDRPELRNAQQAVTSQKKRQREVGAIC